ncbi:hypothetical protein D1631_06255 [Chryseobacterium nematophagum]|uniref:Uncharacterized protein n=1 Tax=Chryseobacterium nematophagum TaxID=2305228 RepID=A0A3M7TFZ7_9FLAO|nr:hypothetical protein [Chryseobacterium nematophagum]RNA61559.1 hypothetical protein D1631_06255 [Chryseobacterium nematophagum]
MKQLVTPFILCTYSLFFSQVGINTTTPESTLDIRGKNHLGPVTANDGILVPRVTDLITNGTVNGQLVYLVADSGTVTKGFYFWNGTVWTGFGDTIGDTTNDAWINDSVNDMIRLGTLSNGTTVRTIGTEFVAKDNGAVGIGTNSPDDSAIFDIKSADKGVLIPRVALISATDQTTIPSPAVGLLVYNTGAATLAFKGFVFWNGTEWRSINNETTINPTISGLNCNGASAFPPVFISGTPYNGTLTVPYSNGNGGSYQTNPSFTQNGLTFSLNQETLNIGNGVITYSVTGIPNFSSPNIATIPLSFLGYNCNAVIGANYSSFAVGEVRTSKITVPAIPFITNGGSRNMMNGKAITDITTTDRQAAYELATAADQSKFIIINGLRMDFLESYNNGSVSPKFFNNSSSDLTYNISSLSTNDANITGAGTSIKAGYYSYNIDGNDDFSCTADGATEYVNVMVTFGNGEWYNCTWHATRDVNSYHFYMTAQRLN